MKEHTIENLSLTATDCNIDKNRLLEMYWYFHPRFRFVKSVREKAKLLDVGAGPGGLIFWLDWLQPERKDLRIFAIDLQKGEMFDSYDDYQVCDLEKDDIQFEGKFDAFMLSHVLEHIKKPAILLKKIHKKAAPGALVYIEVPTPATLDLISRDHFLKRGIEISTVNFFDDSSHIQTYSLAQLVTMLSDADFSILESGVIQNSFLGPLLWGYGLRYKDSELTTYGAWLQLEWSHYVIAGAN
jgi:SAM-dependent methyltransferase